MDEVNATEDRSAIVPSMVTVSVPPITDSAERIEAGVVLGRP